MAELMRTGKYESQRDFAKSDDAPRTSKPPAATRRSPRLARGPAPLIAASVILMPLAAACTDKSSTLPSDTDPAATSGSPSGDSAAVAADSTGGNSTTGGGLSQTASCAAYLACAAATTPAELGSLLEAYGPDGTCWQSTPEVAAQCDMACMVGLTQLEDAFPAEPACGGGGPSSDSSSGDGGGSGETWGAACISDAECVALLGEGGVCIFSAVVYELPGGYCTKTCALPDDQTTIVPDAPDCDPAGGVDCIGSTTVSFEICAVPCDDDDDCSRDEYECCQFPQVSEPGDPTFCLMPDCCLGECSC